MTDVTGSVPTRVQLALNVDDVDAAVEFYGRLFGAEPAKRRPGYANFAIDSPPLKLVLLENPGAGERLNHLGVEVASTDEVAAATRRLAAVGLATLVEDEVTCCYATQDKVWVDAPDGEKWEVYTVLADAPSTVTSPAPQGGACCAPAADAAPDRDAAGDDALVATPAGSSACC